jgi:3'-5' exoribonuclease
MTFISEFKSDTDIKGKYLCKYKQILKNKNGKDYLTVKLQDKTGMIEGKVWLINQAGDFSVDDVVTVEAQVITYQDNLQLNIHKILPADPMTYQLEDFILTSKKDVKDLEKSLFELIDQVKNPFLNELLMMIFCDKQIYEVFKNHSAAKSVHHAYLHGLLEHVVHVTQIGVKLGELYEGVQQDLVISGCLLHDFGKIYELSAFPKNDYTDEGQLIGHLVLGIEKLNDFMRCIPNFPHEIQILLKHIILAHHGEYEYGSPKRPKCIEAMIVHLADNADAKLKVFEEMLENSKEYPYVGYHKLLNRNIRRAQL